MKPDFDTLVQQNLGRLRLIARRYAGRDGAEDLLQDILLQLWRALPSFRGDARIETFVYRVALNTAMTHVAGLVRVRVASQALAAFPTQDTESGDRDQAEILIELMSSLNEVDASILMMYLDNLGAEDMASVIGITANNINVRLSRMKRRFYDQLN